MGLFSKSAEATTNIKINVDSDKAKSSLSTLKGAIAGVVSVYALKQVASYTYELSKLGAQADVVGKNFSSFAKSRNRDVDDMMKSLRSATMGMVSDMELQQKAMQAMIGGVKFDDLLVAMEYVTKFASATGQDVSTKMQSTMTGLARKSAQFLDDIGIQVMGSKDVVKSAIDQMKEKMGQFTTSEQDATVQAEKLRAEFENLKVELGKNLIPVLNIAISKLNELAQGAKWKLGGEAAFKAEQERVAAIQKEIVAYGELKKEQEVLLQMQTALKNAGSAAFDPTRLNDLKNNIAFISEEIKRLNNEALGVSNTSPTEPGDNGGPSAEELERRKKKQAAILEMMMDDDIEVRKKGLQELTDNEEEYAAERLRLFQQERDNRINLQNEAYAIQHDLLAQSSEGRQQLLYKEYEQNYMILEKAGMDTAALTEQYEKEKTRITEEESQKRINAAEKEKQGKIQNMQDAVNSASNFNNALMNLSQASTNRELRNLDKKKLGERRYNKEKEKILAEQEQQQRAFARVQQALILGETIMAIARGSAEALKKGFFGIAELAFVGATGAVQIAAINAQHFQRGYLGEVDRIRRPDDMDAKIGRNEAVIPAPQYAMHKDEIRAIVNGTANNLNRAGRGMNVNIVGMSSTQAVTVINDLKRRNDSGKLI